MSPINPNQSTQPSLASYLPQIDSSFPNKRARTHSMDRVDETAGSIMQVNYGLINIPTVGSHNEIAVHYHSTNSDAQLLREILRPLQSVAVQPNNAPLASLGIEGLQKKYLESLEKDREIKDALAMYVAPECISITNIQERFSLEEKVRDFLASREKKVLLLLGVAGSGKSTFNRYLARSLWGAFDKEVNKSNLAPIPLFISLSSLKEPNNNLISEYLKKEGFKKEQIADLKANYRFIFILDGYDEIKDRTRFFYLENELDGWQAKVIVTSRPEYLGDRYERQFHPKGQAYLLQTYQLAPFSNLTIEEYVSKYKNSYPELEKSITEHGEILERSEVKELIRNPFLLKLSLSELPALAEKYRDCSQRITRIALYDQFVESWFERSQDRLSGIRLTDAEQKAFHFLNKAFIKHGTKFIKDLAIEMYQAGVVRVTYSEQLSYDESNALAQDWQDKFLSESNEKIKLLRFNAPLVCRDDQYEFIHKSIQDYLVARVVWEGLDNSDQVDEKALLNRFNLVEDAAIQRFLVEQVQENKALLKPLLAWIQASRQTESVSQGAANAITILVRAGVQFNGKDLQGIRIRGADLSYGVFDSAQLQGADLSQVKLRNSWLHRANLSGAKMKGVWFGEWPYLKEKYTVSSCIYSPDGKACAVGLYDGAISVYATSNWEKIGTLKGHTNSVRSVVYSPSGYQIASGSEDNTVRLWNAQTGKAGLILEGHINVVTSVVYSPSGHQIASGSEDNTVRLWDAQSGVAVHILEGHTWSVTSVTYSPSGHQITSGSYDGTVRLWDAETGEPGPTLAGHTFWVSSVVYSPSGHQIASGSWDNTIRLWDAQTGEAGLTLDGHTGHVTSVVYSPSGHQIASASFDNTVRLWDAQTGEPGPTLAGHTFWIKSVVYSPSGHQIASGGVDHTVRLWDAQTVEARPTEGHISHVESVTYSPSGHQIASGSLDNTVQLWNAQTGEAGPTLAGHTGSIQSVVYSPSGHQIASGSVDKTIRLWDVQTGKAGPTLAGHTSLIQSVVYSPSGHQIASGSVDHTVRLWDAQAGETGLTLTGHTGSVNSVAYSPGGRQIASGSGDKTVRLWDAQTGGPGPILAGHTDSVSCVVYSPSGRQIASASHDKTVRLWDAQTGEPGPTLVGHTDMVIRVVYSPSGHQIASGSFDETVRLWNAQTGEAGPTLAGHTSHVTSVIYSSNGDQIASSSLDNTVRLWNVASGQCLAVVRGFHNSVNDIAWKTTLSGTYLVTGCSDKSVRVWQIIEGKRSYQIRLHWSSRYDNLTVADTVIEGVQGLSWINQQLLQQRGAVEGRYC
ncbi:MAG: WD40 repeat [Glomeribacter sp. 1016415]|nr:WD40 repeat [Glomeribacter sp. 1016415]